MRAQDRLTRKQRRLVRQIDETLDTLNLNHRTLLSYRRQARSAKLEQIVRWVARAAVVESYTLVDEFLADQICWYFFGRSRPFWRLWKTKRFSRFNHFIVQGMYPLEKLRLVRAFRNLPRPVVKNIQELNTLRNAMAHAFFPENLAHSKPLWRGKLIFEPDVLAAFEQDMKVVRNFFFKERAYRRQGRVIRATPDKRRQSKVREVENAASDPLPSVVSEG